MTSPKVLAFAAKVAASGGLLWLAVRNIDFGAAWRALGEVDPRLVALAPVLVFVVEVVSGMRWHMLLRAHGVDIGMRRAVALTLVSNFFNSGLPSTLGGDAVRVYCATKGGATLPAVTATTLLDRFAGMACVTLATLAVTTTGSLADVFGPLWQEFAVALTVPVVAGFAVLAAINYVPRPKSWAAPRAAGTGWKGAVVETLLAIAGLRVSVGATAVATALSVVVFGLLGLALAAISAATGEAGALGVARGIAIAAPMILASSVPISFGGWGVREVLLVQLFPQLGLPAEAGLITSVLYGLSVSAGSAPGLLVWLAIQRR